MICPTCRTDQLQPVSTTATKKDWTTWRCPECGIVEYPPEPVVEVARKIVDGGAFHQRDAERLASAYLEAVA